jgi:predicted nucleic acid-binding protein
MPFVVDVSVAAAWMLPDENEEAAEDLLYRLPGATALVPSLFWHEARSVMLTAERRGRIAAGEAIAAMSRLRRLPLEDAGVGQDTNVLALAARHQLRAYDASYLALAVDSALPLATLDRRLAAAARAEGIATADPRGETKGP